MPDETTFFRQCRKQANDLCGLSPFSDPAKLYGALLGEIAFRLNQLDILHGLVQEHEAAFRSDSSSGSIVVRAILFAETFYVFAFRVLDITRYLNKRLFRNKLATEPRGIRDVRNFLVVHPEDRPFPVLTTSAVLLDDGRGIMLKGARGSAEGQDIFDPGFNVNAKEFRDFLLSWFANAKAPLPL